jgi:hypothetical protein
MSNSGAKRLNMLNFWNSCRSVYFARLRSGQLVNLCCKTKVDGKTFDNYGVNLMFHKIINSYQWKSWKVMTGYPETSSQTKKYTCTQTIHTEMQYTHNNCTPKCQAGSYIHTLVIKANYGFINVQPKFANVCRNGLSDFRVFASGEKYHLRK